ncbi:MAG: protein kinase [Candidatus Aminicenantes bacterium]|nr:protein kinase [Candidatus Aminicenantes bacterium]
MENIGKYKILEELGKGAMGVVYKALDPDIDREVAIKLIRFDMASEESDIEDMAKRFIREAQSAGKLEHPNIITIYEVDRDKGQTFIVMKYIDGDSLKKIISSGKKFPLQDVVQLTDKLCDALDYAHRCKIIHRDIKPANILIDKEGRPFVVDFGVARMEMSTLTQSGAIVGTPSYMAPEQVMGTKVDSRADIFSLGVIIYEMLTGKRPFEGDHITTIVYKIMNEEPPSVLKMQKDLPPGLEQVLSKALSKDPNTRYQSCRELAGALRQAAQMEDATISLSLDRNELTMFRKQRRIKRKLALPISFSVILVAGAAGAILLLPGLKEKILPQTKQEVFLETVPVPDVRSLGGVLELFDENELKLKESFEKGDFKRTVEIAETLISEDPTNADAERYLKLAKQKIEQAAVASTLRSGIASFNNGEYETCQRIMKDILTKDKNNREAQRYLDLAGGEISKLEIRDLVERQRKTEEGKDLLTLLNDIGSPSLAEKRKLEATDFFNSYDGIKSFVSKTSIQLQGNGRATVVFANLVSAVSKSTGTRKVVFEGNVTLKLEKQGNAWKIVEFHKKSI